MVNHNKSINKKINNLHEGVLRLIYCDHSSDSQELLQRDNSVTIHQKNIQALAIMIYKVVNNIAPTIVSELFSFSNINYNLRSGSQFHQPSANRVWNGQETISYLGPKIWNMVPEEMKQISLLLSKEKLSNGSTTTLRVGYVKTTYLISGLFNTPSCCCFFFLTIYFLSFFIVHMHIFFSVLTLECS